MEKFHKLGHQCLLGLVTLVFAAFFAAAPTQEAEAGQFEIEAGFGWLGIVNHGSDWHGFEFRISPGYRFLDWMGVYLDQGFGGLFYTHDHGHHGDWDKNWDKHWDWDDDWFAGETVVNAKFFLPVGPLELSGKVGIGAFYTASHNHHADWSEGAFAFKLGVGLTYDITKMIGIGGNFDYMLGAFDNWNDHLLDIELHVTLKF